MYHWYKVQQPNKGPNAHVVGVGDIKTPSDI